MTEQDLYYMKEALLEGEKALAEGEVPIGAVQKWSALWKGR